jgi:hypothetical protein
VWFYTAFLFLKNRRTLKTKGEAEPKRIKFRFAELDRREHKRLLHPASDGTHHLQVKVFPATNPYKRDHVERLPTFCSHRFALFPKRQLCHVFKMTTWQALESKYRPVAQISDSLKFCHPVFPCWGVPSPNPATPRRGENDAPALHTDS